ncbi:NTP transferase domain-containing protein [Novosphingobium sp. H3SJ31-1]|uniref:NTP transferase domain-containing protein n=2 Tax=Novosphingobium album (ex Liu et al. 2023) TaxID=3031130 RepID=A0ABT5WLI4_9SPHN|nr:NTP transferase domain-containing protein [Novosphingobium album (ex Liu et al. 2023)]
MAAQDVRIVVLAAQRKGVANPLAERFHVSHKCLIPLHGIPLIRHVMAMLAAHGAGAGIVISVEPEAFAAVREALAGLPDEAAITLCPAADNLADSVLAAAGDHDGPIVITTADHALLRPESVDAMIAALAHADVAIAMARRDAVLGVHAAGQRRFYEFSDHGYSNCNLYALAGRKALGAVEVFRGGGQFAKNAARIVQSFGVLNLLALRFRLVSLAGAMRRISRRIGLEIAPVVIADGSQAIDVDNDRTYAVVSELLTQRERAEAGSALADIMPVRAIRVA